MLGQVDAHGFGGDLVLPDGLESPAVGGVDEHHDDDNAENRDEEGEEGGQAEEHLPAPVGEVEVVEGGDLSDHIGAVGDGPKGLPLEHRSDDLCKAQGGDGQVVALQTQHRQADEPGKEGGHASAQQDGQQHPQDQARGGVHPAEQVRQGEGHR